MLGRTESTSNSSHHYSTRVDWLIGSDNNWILDFLAQRIHISPFFAVYFDSVMNSNLVCKRLA